MGQNQSCRSRCRRTRAPHERGRRYDTSRIMRSPAPRTRRPSPRGDAPQCSATLLLSRYLYLRTLRPALPARPDDAACTIARLPAHDPRSDRRGMRRYAVGSVHLELTYPYSDSESHADCQLMVSLRTVSTRVRASYAPCRPILRITHCTCLVRVRSTYDAPLRDLDHTAI